MTDCYYCDTPQVLDGAMFEITEEIAGPYYEFNHGMVVAYATCPLCEAKYLAWMFNIPRWNGARTEATRNEDGEIDIQDLSFRSTFNDEPGDDDLPKWKIGKVRIGPWEP